MRNLALLLLLAVIASMIFTFDPLVLAQETPETTSEEEMTEEETSEEETAEEMEDEMMEEAMEDEMMEEAMEEAMEEEDVDSPLEQLMSLVDPHEIQCKSGQTLVFKASNWRPACVNESSLDILVLRGWVANHEPTHEDLTKMQDDLMAAHMQEEEEVEEEIEEEVEEETEEEVEEEMEEEVEEETETEGETIPQNHTVNLKESMDMGAN